MNEFDFIKKYNISHPIYGNRHPKNGYLFVRFLYGPYEMHLKFLHCENRSSEFSMWVENFTEYLSVQYFIDESEIEKYFMMALEELDGLCN